MNPFIKQGGILGDAAQITQQAPVISPDALDIARKKRMADMLMNQGNQELQGSMVSGRYVGPSWTQTLSKGLSMYLGNKAQQDVEKGAQELGQKQQQQRAQELENFIRLSQGAAPVTAVAQAVRGDGASSGDVIPNQQTAMGMPSATQMPTGDRFSNQMQAYAALLKSQSPELQQMGMQGMASLPSIQAKEQERQQERDFRMQQMQEQHALRMQQMQEENKSRSEMRQADRDFQRQMMRERATTAAQPYYQPVQTAQGVMAFNARTGRMEPINIGGSSVVGAQYDPSLKEKLASAGASGKIQGETRAQAQVDLPSTIAQAQQTVGLVDELLKAPGFKQAVGGSRMFGIQNIPGTSAKDFDVRLDQLKGKQFMEAYQGLKGGGQITEVEGKKATDALSRMNASSSEQEFTKAAREFQDVVRKGVQRAQQKAGVQSMVPSQQPQGLPQGWKVLP